MAFVNDIEKEIRIKIVYYGPAGSGKMTNLTYIHRVFRDRINTDILTINTLGDQTIFFDFFPFDIAKIDGYHIKVQLYTAPGEQKYNTTRRLMLHDVDGIVFVADSMAIHRQKNFEALKNLQKNLASHKRNIFKIPMIFQYNKRDIKDIPILPFKTMEKELNGQLKVPSFEAVAQTGENVILTLKKIISETFTVVRDSVITKEKIYGIR